MEEQMPPAPPSAAASGSSSGDLTFAYELREAITQYLAAVDAWERRYGQTYRMPSRGGEVTADLADETQHYRKARRALEALVPRARLTYSRLGIRDPFNALLRVNLGAGSPQTGTRASIGGNERTEVARGLVDLIAACGPIADRPRPQAKPMTIMARIINFFR